MMTFIIELRFFKFIHMKRRSLKENADLNACPTAVRDVKHPLIRNIKKPYMQGYVYDATKAVSR